MNRKIIASGAVALGVIAGVLFPRQEVLMKEVVTGQEPVKETVIEKKEVVTGQEPVFETVTEKETKKVDIIIPVESGYTNWNAVQGPYKVKDPRGIIEKIFLVVETNAGEYPHLRIDNRAVKNGVVVNEADGIPGDVARVGDKYRFPSVEQTVDVQVRKQVGLRDVKQTVEERVENVTGYKDIKKLVEERYTRFPGLDWYMISACSLGALSGIGMSTAAFYIRRKRLEKYLASAEAQELMSLLYLPIVAGGVVKAIS